MDAEAVMRNGAVKTDFEAMGHTTFTGAMMPAQLDREGIAEFMKVLRLTASERGLQAALQQCAVAGPCLWGVQVYSYATTDQWELKCLTEAAGGIWLENPPHPGSPSTLIFGEMFDVSNMMGGYAMPTQMKGQWNGGKGDQQRVWTSQESYLQSRLRSEDQQEYRAAGLILYRRGSNGVELLLPTETPWNSWEDKYDPLSWNILGTKRSRGNWEREPVDTVQRCVLDVIGHIKGAPTASDIRRICRRGVAVWYARGKYAISLSELCDEDRDKFDNPSLTDRFKAEKEASESSDAVGLNSSRFTKRIDGFEWVSGAELLSSRTRMPLANLLDNVCMVDGFRHLLTTSSLPDGVQATKGGDECDTNCDRTESEDGKGKKGRGDNAKGKSGRGFGKAQRMVPMSEFTNSSGGKVGKGKEKGRSHGMSGAYASEFLAVSVPEGSDTERQMIGEQIYLLVQQLVPTVSLAQKVTGMLLELPQPELVPLLVGGAPGQPSELEQRVEEALIVLRSDGVA